MQKAARFARRLLDVALIGLVVFVLGLVLAVNLGPVTGHQLVVIRGGSMEPAVHLGSVIVLSNVKPTDLRAGDIVTLKETNDVVVTHRVTRVVTLPDGIYIETKGDANPTVDPVLVPATAVTGRVGASVPGLGYVIYLMTLPLGLLAVLCLALSLLFAIWLLEEFESDGVVVIAVEPYESDLARLLDKQRTDGQRMREPIG
ncbi:MAG TPA: signal peptidase I [Candidatus Limnocylindrales bacterium]